MKPIIKKNKEKNTEKNAGKISEKYASWLPFLLFLLILLAAQPFIALDYGDDLTYASVWGEEPLDIFLRGRYRYWSSRVVIEAVMMPLTAAPHWIWRSLNIIMVLLLVWITADLFGIKASAPLPFSFRNITLSNPAQLLFFGIMWSVPMVAVSGAGWITTTTNYLWVLVLGLIAMRPLKHWLCSEKCPSAEYILCPLCLLYAANMEQMAAILLGVYLVFGVYLLITKKKLSPFFFLQLLLILWSLHFILASPGNHARYLVETDRRFPEFPNLCFGEKLLLGFLTTAHYHIAAGHEQSNYLFALLSGVLFIFMLRRLRKDDTQNNSARPLIDCTQNTPDRTLDDCTQNNPDRTLDDCTQNRPDRTLDDCTQNRPDRTLDGCRRWLSCLIALCPLASYWDISRLGNILLDAGVLTRGLNAVAVLSRNDTLPGFGYFSGKLIAFQTAAYLMIIGCVLLTILFLHGKSKETFFQWLILGAGFTSSIITGFSPTVAISIARTTIFLSMSVLIVTLRNLQMYLSQEQKIHWKVILGVYVSMCILGNLF